MMRRARTTRPSSQKWQAILCAGVNGSSSEFNVHCRNRCAGGSDQRANQPGQISRSTGARSKRACIGGRGAGTTTCKAALIEASGEAAVFPSCCRRFGGAFPARYREESRPRRGARCELRPVSDTEPLGMHLYRTLEAPPGNCGFQTAAQGAPLTLWPACRCSRTWA